MSQYASPTSSPPIPLRAAVIAEALGTFALVFLGCGAIIVNQLTRGVVTHLGVSLVFGMVVAAMIYAVGHISGAHFNPAVTLGFVVSGHLPARRLPAYWAAQCGSAIVAAMALRGLFGNVAHLGATLPNGGAGQSFILEILLTFFLMFVIIAVATDTRAPGQAAALAIGATVALEALFGGPISGASMNPARSLGPALVSGVWSDQWLYVLAPLLGAIAAAWLYEWLRAASTHPSANNISGAIERTPSKPGIAADSVQEAV